MAGLGAAVRLALDPVAPLLKSIPAACLAVSALATFGPSPAQVKPYGRPLKAHPASWIYAQLRSP